MEWLDEYEKLVIGMNTPRVVIDNAVCPTATLVQVDSATKRGVLLEAVQLLADLHLSVNKAYISSDGRWFMDVFHVTDRLGRKLTDHSVITYIEQSLGSTWNGPARPAALEGLTALELTGADRTGLLSEVFAVLADMDCSVVEAQAWTHRGRLGCIAFLRNDDSDALTGILARLGHLVRAGDDAPGAVAAVPASTVAHADRRLHQLMSADRDRALASFPASTVAHADRRLHQLMSADRDRALASFPASTVAHADRRLHQLMSADRDRALASFPASTVAHADRRLHQLMSADRDRALASFPATTPAVSVESWADERGYSVVTVRCRDRPKLLFDVVCTLNDMDYVVFHGTVDTSGDQARQELYIRHADGSPIRTEAESQRVSQCLQAAIERRRSLEGVMRLELCAPDRPGLLSDVTRTFRENGLLVAQAEVSTKGDVASNVFYVTDAAAGNAVDQGAIVAVRERLGMDRLVVKEERQPQLLFQKKPRPGDRRDGGIGLVYLGNLVKRNLYNLGLIKSCS